MSIWDAVPGETPIDPSGLRNRGSITTRSELAAAEARNINEAFLKYLASRPSSRSAPFDYEWFLKLHHEMFGEVWSWAGSLRTMDSNIGVPSHQIIEQLSALVGDLNSWSGYEHALETQAVWLHHKAIWIHPFPKGNGRWARLLSNIWLKRHGEPIVSWPDRSLRAASEVREEYLAAIGMAHGGNYSPLTELHDRFTSGT